MAFLPHNALTLTGGCSCGAARYTVSIPDLAKRPAVPGARPTPISSETTTTTTLPMCVLDHCVTCRRVSGSIITCWLIVPPTWLTWSILPIRSSPSSATIEAGPIDEATPTRLDNIPTVDICGPSAHPSSPLTQHLVTERAIRTFCRHCGTHLTYYNLAGHGTPSVFVDITVGSLDEESLRMVRPERHAWWDSGISWVRDLMRWGTGAWIIRHHTGARGVVEDKEERGLDGAYSVNEACRGRAGELPAQVGES